MAPSGKSSSDQDDAPPVSANTHPKPRVHERLRNEIEDMQDLQAARLTPEESKTERPFWRMLGPGLITGAADDDPSGIGTYSVAGAQFGLAMLWLVPFLVPLMIVVQEMCGRIGVITGKGLAGVLKEHYSRWILWSAVLLLIFANTINVWADLNVMAASARMLSGPPIPFDIWLALITGATLLLQVLVPYRRYVKYLKWMCLSLLAYVVTALLPTVHLNWGNIVANLLIPRWNHDPAFLLTVVGFVGTTISPYLFFWQAGETVEEEVVEGKAKEPGKRIAPVTDAEIRACRADTVIGMIASQAICFFIIICTASQLHAKGITNIDTAQDAAKALLPLGSIAYWLFTLGILGTGLLAIPTLAGSVAYAVAETAGWKYGLYRRFRRARPFYLTISAVIIIGYLLNFVHSFSPIKGLLYSAVLNGVIAPPLIVLLLLVCNNSRVVNERKNTALSNVLGWLTVVLMSAAAAFMFYAMATGQAS